MTCEEPESCSEKLLKETQTTRRGPASDHGRGNILVKPVDSDVVALPGGGVGLVEPLEVAINLHTNQAE